MFFEVSCWPSKPLISIIRGEQELDMITLMITQNAF